jgi:hypothetical protein
MEPPSSAHDSDGRGVLLATGLMTAVLGVLSLMGWFFGIPEPHRSTILVFSGLPFLFFFTLFGVLVADKYLWH